MEIGMVIQAFGFDCKIRKLSPKTIENYPKQLGCLQRYLTEEHDMAEIEAVRSIHIRQFLALMDERGPDFLIVQWVPAMQLPELFCLHLPGGKNLATILARFLIQ